MALNYTATSLTETIIRGINGGNFTSDQKVDPEYILNQLPRWRAMAIPLFYSGGKVPNSNTIIKGSKYLDSNNYQIKEYKIDPNIQNSNYDYLISPSCGTVDLSSNLGGLQYIGAIDRSVNFFVAKTRIEVQQLRDLGFNKKPIAMIEGETRLIYEAPLLVEFLEVAVYSNPYFHKTDFNLDTDSFPVCDQIANLMKSIAVAELRPEFTQPKDVLADGANNEQAIIKQTQG